MTIILLILSLIFPCVVHASSVDKGYNDYTTETSIAADDYIPFWDTSAGKTRKMPMGNVFYAPSGVSIISAATPLSGTSVSIANAVYVVSGGTYYSTSGSGTTLNFHGPFDAGLFACFNSAQNATGVTVVFHPKSVDNVKANWFLPSSGSHVTAWQRAADSALDSNSVIVTASPGTYDMSGVLTVNKPMTIDLTGVTLTWTSDTSTYRGIKVLADDVSIRGNGWLMGPQYTTGVTTQNGIWAKGTLTNKIDNLKITGLKIKNWGDAGIYLEFCRWFEVVSNHIENTFYYGIACYSGLDGVISKNTVDNVVGLKADQPYGIILTKNNGTEATYPTTKRVAVTNNVVSQVTGWEGIDSHGGQDLIVSGNIVKDCYSPIILGSYDYGGNTYAINNIVISGNSIRRENISGASTYRAGIIVNGYVSGVTNDWANGVVVSDNVIENYGDETALNGDGAGLYILGVNNFTSHNNVMRNNGSYGTYVYGMGSSVHLGPAIVSGVTNPFGAGLFIESDNTDATGIIDGQIIRAPMAHGAYLTNYIRNVDTRSIKIESAATPYGQTGGTYANEFFGDMSNVVSGATDWSPGTIASGASTYITTNNLPGVSYRSSVNWSVFTADAENVEPLRGLNFTCKARPVDTNYGNITWYLHNLTGADVVMPSINIRYRVDQNW